MKSLTQFVITSLGVLLMGTNASAYTRKMCQNADSSKTISLLFDAADNYFVNAALSINDEVTYGTLQGDDPIRPRPGIDPDHPLLTLSFGESIFVLSADAASAVLSDTVHSETMSCCVQVGPRCLGVN